MIAVVIYANWLNTVHALSSIYLARRSMFHGNRYVEISRALMSDHFDAKTFHTTFIVKKGRIQKIGVNLDKTHPTNLKYTYQGKDGTDIRRFVGIHSELSAILKYGREDCSDCVFVNVRIDKNGDLAMSKPCIGCQDLLKQIGFKKLWYSNNQNSFEEWV